MPRNLGRVRTVTDRIAVASATTTAATAAIARAIIGNAGIVCSCIAFSTITFTDLSGARERCVTSAAKNTREFDAFVISISSWPAVRDSLKDAEGNIVGHIILCSFGEKNPWVTLRGKSGRS